MSRTKRGSPPNYRHYKRTNQAVVTIDGKDIYLGEFGSDESMKKYTRLIDGWRARQERSGAEAQTLPPLDELLDSPTVNEIILAYIKHASSYYKPSAEGEEKEVGCIR